MTPLGRTVLEGTAAAGNVPGAREWPISWTDAAGNFWLFGGLWLRLSGNTGSSTTCGSTARANGRGWADRTWSTSRGRTGLWGRLPASNVPGARYRAVSWTDAAGNFWLFGGDGYDSAGTLGIPQRPVEVQRGPMDVDGRVERRQPEGDVRDSGDGCRGQRSWGARACCYLDRCGRKFLALRWGWLRLSGDGRSTSTTCGSTARANGRGWADRTWSTSRGRTGLRGRLPRATFLGREARLLLGPMRPEISGSSVGWVTRLSGDTGYLNDLWKYSAGQWTWMGGSNVVNQAGRTGLRGRLPRATFLGRDLKRYLDRCGRKFLALRWVWLRLSGHWDTSTTCGSTARANGRGWAGRTWSGHGRAQVPTRDVRHAGDDCARQHSWSAIECRRLDRSDREFVAFRRAGLRLSGAAGNAQRPMEVRTLDERELLSGLVLGI